MSRGEAPRVHPGLSVIAADATVTGDIVTTGDVLIEGHLSGDLRAGGQVLVASGGGVSGEIHAEDVVVGGEVVGPVDASRVELQDSAVARGAVRTRRLRVAEGASLDIEVCMEEPIAVLHRGAA